MALDLALTREKIDAVDDQIVRLFEERMKLACDVAEYKISVGKQVYDKQREEEKIAVLRGKSDDEFIKMGIGELFNQIMSISRKKQYMLLNEKGMGYMTDFKAVDELDCKGKKVAYQGVAGAYSQIALKTYFGDEVEDVNVATWRDAMEMLKNGEVDFAVLPFENSSAGIIEENFDLLNEYGFFIVGEQKIRVNHCILGTKDSTLEDIKEVYSHPKALAQCTNILDENSKWDRVALKNTALAAKYVMEENDKTKAAIASTLTAEIYDLKILAEGVQNESENETKFIIVSREKIYKRGANKITMSLEIKHQSGALYHILSHFIFNNINMTAIESRPLEGRNWEYRFFIDVDGSLEDASVQNAICGLMDDTNDLRIFGNY